MTSAETRRLPRGQGVREALAQAARELDLAGVDTARVDAELLLAAALRTSRTGLYARTRPLTGEEADAFERVLARRARREPLAYVLGEWGFRRLTLATDARALVPRPETEAVVERCLELLSGLDEPAVLDLGTGTGAIALALADEHPGASVTAVDSSTEALALARENLARLGLAGGRIRIVEGDLDAPPGSGYDLVVSNPPYVLPEELDGLEPEVRDWEPRAALVSTDATRRVAAAAPHVLRPGGVLVLEVASARAAEAADELRRLGYVEVRIGRDLSGRERVVEGRRP